MDLGRLKASVDIGALVAGRYEQQHYIGSGAYGTIRRATDVLSGTDVAIKWLSNVSKDRSKMVLTLRELHLLRCLSSHPNIISLRDAVLERRDDVVDLYLVMDLKEVDLQQLIDSQQVKPFSYSCSSTPFTSYCICFRMVFRPYQERTISQLCAKSCSAFTICIVRRFAIET